jgi:hypothetical protein
MSDTHDTDTQTVSGAEPAVDAPHAFAAGEMVTCSACSRLNPPNRFRCIYCGGSLTPAATASNVPVTKFRRPETWESGFNVVLLPGSTPDAIAEALERDFDFSPQDAYKLSVSTVPVPVSRLESMPEAENIAERLRVIGASSVIVSDAALSPKTPQRRLRSLDLSKPAIRAVDFNTSERLMIGADDIIVIVKGSLFSKKVESTSKRSKGSSKAIEESETVADEEVIDIYTVAATVGYRISAVGFDFSCLGEGKGLLSAVNLARLASMLHRFAPNAKLIDDYPQLRDAISGVWSIEEVSMSNGLRRSGLGKTFVHKTISQNNSQQFTKFSRLQRHLI